MVMTGIRILRRRATSLHPGQPEDDPAIDHDQAAVAEREAVTDDSLALAAHSGDDRAFEELFQRHKRRVARVAGRFFAERGRVEEIIQEVFVKVYFALGDYKPDASASFSAWVSRIAVNACYDQLRKTRRRPEGALAPEDAELVEQRARLRGETKSAETALISRDLAAKLLARIKPEDRVVLTLLDAEEMSVSEIAQVMGWTASKVKVRAHRARAALRRVLDQFL